MDGAVLKRMDEVVDAGMAAFERPADRALQREVPAESVGERGGEAERQERLGALAGPPSVGATASPSR